MYQVHDQARHQAVYQMEYDAKSPELWKKSEPPGGVDTEFVCIGVKASNYFMPKECLSEKGPAEVAGSSGPKSYCEDARGQDVEWRRSRLWPYLCHW